MTMAISQQQRARQAVLSALTPFGYDGDCVRFDWRLPDSDAVQRYILQDQGDPEELPAGQLRRLDVLAFSDPRRQDWNTSAVAADFLQDGVVGNGASRDKAKELFRLTAAPTNLVGSLARRKVDVWLNCHDGMVGAQEVDLEADALKAVFRQHRSTIQRDLLAHLQQEQRHLFDGYLYARRDELTTFLQRGVSKATWIVDDRAWGPDKAEAAAMREAFSRVALALLAARILEDKGALGEGRDQSAEARQLLWDARKTWDSFFETVIEQDLPRLDGRLTPGQVDAMLRCLLRHLTGPVNFGLVTHDMLGDLYERALVAERKGGRESFVKLEGVHYTQLSITRQILDRIPFEYLPPSHRTVCDFACGSGSFLLAATERLAGLLDPREPGFSGDALSYLKYAVMGNDIDGVAILVASLSYLLAYWNRADSDGRIPFPSLYPGGNALDLDLTAAFGRLPGVIVSNPPFDKKGQPASEFLLRALNVLSHERANFPAYLGIVMPAAFLTGTKNQKLARQRLLEVARILEVWELPEHAIGQYAEASTCVIIAEVGSTRPACQPVRALQTYSRQREAVRALRDRAEPTWSYVAAIGREGEEVHGSSAQEGFALSPVDDLWDRMMVSSRSMSMLAEAIWGFLHTRDRHYPDPEFSSTPEGKEFVPYLKHQKAIAPYIVTLEDWRASHDDDQRYWKRGTGPGPLPGSWHKYESDKIIITAQGNRNVRSHLVAALDCEKFYPGKHFLAVVLRDDWSDVFENLYGVDPGASRDILRWLCAILNSPLGHSWFAKQAGPRGLRAEICTGMPLPRSFDPAISEAVAEIEDLPRPRNFRQVATWDPQVSNTPEESLNPFIEESEVAGRDNDYWRAVDRLNELVLGCYGLSPTDRSRVLDYLRGMTDPWANHPRDASSLPNNTILRVVRGKTIGIDPLRQVLKAELSWRTLGGGNAVTIPVPKFMPGWALDGGQQFTCRAPAGASLEAVTANPWLLRDFRPVPYGYLGVEPLEKMVGYQKVVD